MNKISWRETKFKNHELFRTLTVGLGFQLLENSKNPLPVSRKRMKWEGNLLQKRTWWQNVPKNQVSLTCMSLGHHLIQRFWWCIPSHFLVHAWIEQTDLWMFSRHAKNRNIEVNQNWIIDKSFLFIVRHFWTWMNYWPSSAIRTGMNEVPVKPAGHWQWFGLMHTPSFKQAESQTGDEQSLPDHPLSQEHLTKTLSKQFNGVYTNYSFSRQLGVSCIQRASYVLTQKITLTSNFKEFFRTKNLIILNLCIIKTCI